MLAVIWGSSCKSVSWENEESSVLWAWSLTFLYSVWNNFLCSPSQKEYPFSITISTVTANFPACGNFQLLHRQMGNISFDVSLLVWHVRLGIGDLSQNPRVPQPSASSPENGGVLQALHSLVFTSLVTVSFSFQTNSSAIIDRIFASEGVVNSAIPAYHLRDLIKRYHSIFDNCRLKMCSVKSNLALSNLEPTPHTFFFFSFLFFFKFCGRCHFFISFILFLL